MANYANPTANHTNLESQTPPYDYASGFYLSLRASGRLSTTEHTYRNVLTALGRFAAEMGMPTPALMTAEHLRHYFASMYAKGNRPGTVSVHYRALSSFYKWLVNEGEIRQSTLRRVTPPKPEQRIRAHYEGTDIQRLLASIAKSNDALSLAQRDAAIVTLLYDTGLRAAEVCGLTRADFDPNRLTLRVYGKGQKERLVGVGYVAAQAVERYLRRRTDNTPWLFTSWHGVQLTFNALTIMLRKRFKQAGLDFGGVHGFRRGFAMAFLDSGGSPEDLRELCGWESPEMLRHYVRATAGERALRGHRQHSPADALGKARRGGNGHA